MYVYHFRVTLYNHPLVSNLWGVDSLEILLCLGELNVHCFGGLPTMVACEALNKTNSLLPFDMHVLGVGTSIVQTKDLDVTTNFKIFF